MPSMTLHDMAHLPKKLRKINKKFPNSQIPQYYGPWALLNLKLNYEICRYISIFTRLENITDTHYFINRGYDMPGFTAMGGFKLSFQLSSAGSLRRANRLLSGSRSGNFVFLTCCYVRLENGFRRVERRFIICES